MTAPACRTLALRTAANVVRSICIGAAEGGGWGVLENVAHLVAGGRRTTDGGHAYCAPWGRHKLLPTTRHAQARASPLSATAFPRTPAHAHARGPAAKTKSHAVCAGFGLGWVGVGGGGGGGLG
jgi:hypothetical protein